MHLQIRTSCQKGEINIKKSSEGLIVRFQQTLITLIYRPPYSKKNPVQMHTFLDEIVDFLTSLLQENSQPIIIGNFSVLWNLPDQTDTQKLIEIINTFNLPQEIEFPTHKVGNTLDWIIHKEDQNCIHSLTKLEFLSDHCIIE